MKVLNDLLGYKNRKLYQDSEMFNFTLDSVLVARFANLTSKRKMIVDFGTNNAVIPLIISKYTKAKIIGVEIQPKAAELAQQNIWLNNLSNQIEIICDDIKHFAKTHNQVFDLVICNPPFFKMDGKPKLKKISQEVIIARHETLITLEEIIYCASKCLKNGGNFTIVHRAERAGEIINLFYKYHIYPKRMMLVQSKPDQDAKTILIDGIYQGNEGMQILPTLITHNTDETYTDELLRYFHD
ncbi:tRNA1(Val) (adenine(37)-N6)-methyltransferase [Mycoplasma putrefaciens]|uniref:Methyltransferase n=1 Tax=Mycoplasma putrefaciens Mput9231 TaxID=1292033 RepID=M9WBI2_9MOLU|nr:tRNA1(Val) (adenine(37)-N6)-methyltransferase [Mycoplasma putrefaciens]AGJ90472.1 Methyltransferase [Mycoplasma putrefaciens Mput9231]